jgi:hypothetical protein
MTSETQIFDFRLELTVAPYCVISLVYLAHANEASILKTYCQTYLSESPSGSFSRLTGCSWPVTCNMYLRIAASLLRGNVGLGSVVCAVINMSLRFRIRRNLGDVVIRTETSRNYRIVGCYPKAIPFNMDRTETVGMGHRNQFSRPTESAFSFFPSHLKEVALCLP